VTELERRVLAAALEFATANDELGLLLARWDKGHRPDSDVARAAHRRADQARAAFNAVSDEYRIEQSQPAPYRFGPWALGTEDERGNITLGPGGTKLYHDGGPWGITLDRLRTPDDYEFWRRHVSDKGWGYKAVNGLNWAFTALNPDDWKRAAS
jgi:hypothetical protein